MSDETLILSVAVGGVILGAITMVIATLEVLGFI